MRQLKGIFLPSKGPLAKHLVLTSSFCMPLGSHPANLLFTENLAVSLSNETQR